MEDKDIEIDPVAEAKLDASLAATKADLMAKPENAGRELVCFFDRKSGCVVFFRIPNGTEIDVYKSRLGGEKKNAHSAGKALCATVRAYPEAAEYQKILHDRPFFMDKWFNLITDAAGLASEFEEKKL